MLNGSFVGLISGEQKLLQLERSLFIPDNAFSAFKVQPSLECSAGRLR